MLAGGRGFIVTHKFTTKPGAYWLKDHVGNENGTFILKEGFYPSCWKMGEHKGKYKSLIQSEKSNFEGFRDKDKNGLPDYEGPIYKDVTGLNCHSTRFDKEVERIGAFSAGCQVRESGFDHLVFMALVNKSMKIYGKYVSYGLTNIKDFF